LGSIQEDENKVGSLSNKYQDVFLEDKKATFDHVSKAQVIEIDAERVLEKSVSN